MLFPSLHSSKRKFATAQYVNRERFLLPYLHSLFVICSSARATRTVFCSFIFCLTFPLLHSLSLGEGWGEDIFFVFSLSARVARTVFCSFIVRLLFVHCSSFVRLLFVHCSFIVRSLFVHCSFFHYLPVWLAPSFYYPYIVL